MNDINKPGLNWKIIQLKLNFWLKCTDATFEILKPTHSPAICPPDEFAE